MVIIGLAFIVGMSGIQARELHFGEHYTVDASLEETIDFFLETRDSLYNYSDEEMRKEFYPIASIDSIRKSIQNGVVNSSTLGFFRSFVLARRFEWTILSESNFGWRNTTPIVVRLNPLYTWTYNIFDQAHDIDVFLVVLCLLVINIDVL